MTLSAVGAGAVNQAVKGVAVACGLVAPDMTLACVPGFDLVELPSGSRTGLRLLATGVCAPAGGNRTRPGQLPAT